MPPEERVVLRDKTKFFKKNLYTLKWTRVVSAMQKIDATDFRVFRRSSCQKALAQTLVTADTLSKKEATIRTLTHENTQLRASIAKLKSYRYQRARTTTSKPDPPAAPPPPPPPQRPSKSNNPCWKCLRDGIGKQFHNADECTTIWREHVMNARKANHEKQLNTNKQNKIQTNRQNKFNTNNVDWKTTPCPTCVAHGVTGRQANHPRHDLCIRLIMNKMGITDRNKRDEILKDFFASRKARQPFPLVEQYKQSLLKKRKSDTSTQPTPPKKKGSNVKTTDLGSLENPNDPWGLGLDPIPDIEAYIPSPVDEDE